MKLPSAPLRFVLAIVGGWTALRIATLIPGEIDPIGEALVGVPPAVAATRETTPWRSPFRPPASIVAIRPILFASLPNTGQAEHLTRLTSLDAARDVADHQAAFPRRSETPPFPSSTPSPDSPSRWSGSAWLFARPGASSGLATGSQLGGGQVGARLAYRLNAGDVTRIAAAARVSTPLANTKGAEGAIGLDLYPLAGAPFRLSIERRIAIRDEGRNAWSAYAAGGFYRALGAGIELDGYAQAGVVGVRAADLFADGALRVGRRVQIADRKALVIGAGLWGAAQPGASRLDIGPRAAFSLPAGRATITAALEGRVRVGGDARPGSGAAFTLSADF